MYPEIYLEYFPDYPVRIIFREAAVARDLVVQHRVDGKWIDCASYNEMSDDYAFTNARRSAQDVCKRIDYKVEGY